jgi:hypothetical protein
LRSLEKDVSELRLGQSSMMKALEDIASRLPVLPIAHKDIMDTAPMTSLPASGQGLHTGSHDVNEQLLWASFQPPSEGRKDYSDTK